MNLKRLIAAALVVLIAVPSVVFAETEEPASFIRFFDDFSSQESVENWDLLLHARNDMEFLKTEEEDFIRIRGNAKTELGKENYTMFGLPTMKAGEEKHPLVLELRVRLSLAKESFVTTSNTSNGGAHSFFFGGTAFGNKILYTDYYNRTEETKISSFEYDEWITVSVVYGTEKESREFYVNGEWAGESPEGLDSKGRSHNQWFATGTYPLKLWLYIKNNTYVDMDYIKLYELTDDVKVQIENSNQADVKSLTLKFDAQLKDGITTDNISVNGVTPAAVSSVGKSGSEYTVVFEEALEYGKDYELTVSGVEDIYGNTLEEKTLGFRTRSKRFNVSDMKLTEDGSEITSFISGTSYVLEGEIKNEKADPESAAVVSAFYGSRGETVYAFTKNYTVDEYASVCETVEAPEESVSAATFVIRDITAPVPLGNVRKYIDEGIEAYEYDFADETLKSLEIKAEIKEDEEEDGEILEINLNTDSSVDALNAVTVIGPSGEIEYIGAGMTTDGASAFIIPLDYTKVGEYKIYAGIEDGGAEETTVEYYSPLYIEEEISDKINSEAASAETVTEFAGELGNYLGMENGGFAELTDTEAACNLFLGIRNEKENKKFNTHNEIISAFKTAVELQKIYEGKDTVKLLSESADLGVSEEVKSIVSETVSDEGKKLIAETLKGMRFDNPVMLCKALSDIVFLAGVECSENYSQTSTLIRFFGKDAGVNMTAYNKLSSTYKIDTYVTGKSFGSISALVSAINRQINLAADGGSSGGSSGGGGGGGGGKKVSTFTSEADSIKPEEKSEEKPVVKPVEFTDVRKGDWYYDDVNFAVEKGLFIGAGNGYFLPSMNLTWEHITIVLGRMGYNYNNINGSEDISRGDFARVLHMFLKNEGESDDHREWVKSRGIFIGDENGDMMFEKTLTRAECCAVMRRISK